MSLRDRLIRRIRTDGPMTVAEWMALCLWDPAEGYYATRQPLGRVGDFVTAPEVSQMFGELTGLAVAQAWADRGGGEMVLCELGPGRGTLMADMMRAAGRVPGFADAVSIHLVEASAPLHAEQERALSHLSPTWHETLETVPEGPLLLVANEFFDALPVRQFIRSEAGWRERVVGLVDGAPAFGLTDPVPMERGAPMGTLIETRPAAEPVMAEIARRIGTHGGAALIVDYGSWSEPGDTLQAVRAHQKVSPLEAPGKADLTAHVDFEALAALAAPLAASLVPQGAWLEALGLTPRAQALAARLRGDALEQHVAAHRRLSHPEEMGALFKILGLTRRGDPPLPGVPSA